MVLLLGPDDTDGLLSLKEANSLVKQGFREWQRNVDLSGPRRRSHLPSGVRVSVHQGGLPGLSLTGLMSHCEKPYFPQQREYSVQRYGTNGMPVFVLYDGETAELRCIVIGEPQAQELPIHVTSGMRTAANSAVGTAALARQDATTLAMLGSQAQAKYHLIALNYLRPLKLVQVFSPNADHRREFAEQMGPLLNMEIIPVESTEEAIRGTDIIMAATGSNTPVFDGSLLEQGVHVTSIVNSNIGLKRSGFVPAMRREIDDATLRRADVIMVNSRETVQLDQPGDLYDPLERSVITWEQIWELGEVLNGVRPGRTNPEQITLFKNTGGTASSDVAIGGRLYQLAVEKGLGTQLNIAGFAKKEA